MIIKYLLITIAFYVNDVFVVTSIKKNMLKYSYKRV